MSDCIPGVAEVIEGPGTNILDWRTRCLARGTQTLGQMDLCRITKVVTTKRSYFGEITVERTRYFHFIAGLHASTPQSLIQYLNGLISAQAREGSADSWKTVRVESATLCVFDAVSQQDLRLDLEVASGNRITIYTVDAVSGQPSYATIPRSCWEAAAFCSALRCVDVPENLPCLCLLPPSVNIAELLKKGATRFLGETTLAPDFVLAIFRFFSRKCLFKQLVTLLLPLQSLLPAVVLPLMARAFVAGGQSAAGLATLARGIQDYPDFRAAFLREQASLLFRVRGGASLALRATRLAVECAPGDFQANLVLARLLEKPAEALLALNLACECLPSSGAPYGKADEERFWDELEQTMPDPISGQPDAQLFAKPRSFEMLREAASTHLISEEVTEQPTAQIGPHDFSYFKEIVNVSLTSDHKAAYKLLVTIIHKANLTSDTLDIWVGSTLANRSISTSLVYLLELLRLDLLRLAQWRDDPNDRAAVVWTARTALAHRLRLLDELELAGRMAQSLWPCPRVWLLVARGFLKRGALPELLNQLERSLRVVGTLVQGGQEGQALEYAPAWTLELLAKAVSRHGLSAIAGMTGEELTEVHNLLDKIRALQSDGCDR